MPNTAAACAPAPAAPFKSAFCAAKQPAESPKSGTDALPKVPGRTVVDKGVNRLGNAWQKFDDGTIAIFDVKDRAIRGVHEFVDGDETVVQKYMAKIAADPNAGEITDNESLGALLLAFVQLGRIR